MKILKIWWFQKYCKSNFDYIFGICVKIECRIFFVIFADSAYSARYGASKFFKNVKNFKKNSQKKSLGEEIWGKRNRHHRENKKWCLGFFNRFLKNWVSTNLQLNENFRNLGVFFDPNRLLQRPLQLNSRKKIFDLESEIYIWYSTPKKINIIPEIFFLIFFSFWDIGLWKYSLVGFLWGPATPQNFYYKIEFYSRNH